MVRKQPPRDDMVRVIVSSADANQDYYLPRARAVDLYNARKLCQVQVEGHSWSFATKNKHRVF